MTGPASHQLHRLILFLGMMGSVHDGEALTAARKAETVRLDLGLSWGELLSGYQIVRDLNATIDNCRAENAQLKQENHDLRAEVDEHDEQLGKLVELYEALAQSSAGPSVEEMCAYLLEDELPEGLNAFVASLQRQYRQRHRL